MSKLESQKRITITTDIAGKCAQCIESKCCRHITEPMDAPRSLRDFDMILWQVSHKNVHCFKDKTGWYLSVFSSCEHLTDKGSCKIYHQRPFICREHSNLECEFDSSRDSYSQLYFTNHKEFDDYCRKRFKRWDRRFD